MRVFASGRQKSSARFEITRLPQVCEIITPMPAAETQVPAPFAGTVIAVAHHPDEPVAAGEALVILA